MAAIPACSRSACCPSTDASWGPGPPVPGTVRLSLLCARLLSMPYGYPASARETRPLSHPTPAGHFSMPKSSRSSRPWATAFVTETPGGERDLDNSASPSRPDRQLGGDLTVAGLRPASCPRTPHPSSCSPARPAGWSPATTIGDHITTVPSPMTTIVIERNGAR
jgi:hypothetical protein